jgi:hypothetical protein
LPSGTVLRKPGTARLQQAYSPALCRAIPMDGLSILRVSSASNSAIKVPLAELAESKEEVRSALNRATRKAGRKVATAAMRLSSTSGTCRGLVGRRFSASRAQTASFFDFDSVARAFFVEPQHSSRPDTKFAIPSLPSDLLFVSVHRQSPLVPGLRAVSSNQSRNQHGKVQNAKDSFEDRKRTS